MSGAKKNHGEVSQAVQPSPSGPASNPAWGTAPHDLQARHGNSAVARALTGANDRGLPAGVLGSMEAAFGRSFSDVRVSEGERVRTGQLAVTEGGTIDFAPGHFQPETAAGRFLLAHELTHVVQQQNGGGAAVLAKADGSRAPSRPDLEREADDVASHIANGGGGPVQVQGRVAPGEPVTLAFEAGEHIRIAWKTNKVWVQMGEFRIPWAFTVAMNGDLFESVAEAKAIAESDPVQFEAVLALLVALPVPGQKKTDDKKAEPKPTAGLVLKETMGIEELLEIAAVDPGQFRGEPPEPGKRKTKKDFDKETIKKIYERYYRLASENIEHYLNPELDDPNLSPLDRIKRGQETKKVELTPELDPARGKIKKIPQETKKEIKEEKAHPNAAGAYREHHEQAIEKAVEAGKKRQGLNEPLLYEGWAAHFLSDWFAGGHIRTVRRDAAKYWDKQAPLFYNNMIEYMSEEVAKWLDSNTGYHVLTAKFLVPLVRKEITAEFKALPKIGAGMALGALTQHDLDNFRGVLAIVAGEKMRLMGDTRLDAATTAKAADVLQMSRRDVEQAYRMGTESKEASDVKRMLQKDGLYAAEHFMPQALPDEDKDVGPGDKSLRWKQSPKDLFDDDLFKEAAKRFLELKADDFEGIVAGLKSPKSTAIQKTLLESIKNRPVNLLWDILNWTPTVGGRSRSIEYLRGLEASNQLGALTINQRRKLVTALISAPMTGEEAILLRSLLLLAPPDEARKIIQSLGADRLAKVLGPRFAEQVSELQP